MKILKKVLLSLLWIIFVVLAGIGIAIGYTGDQVKTGKEISAEISAGHAITIETTAPVVFSAESETYFLFVPNSPSGTLIKGQSDDSRIGETTLLKQTHFTAGNHLGHPEEIPFIQHGDTWELAKGGPVTVNLTSTNDDVMTVTIVLVNVTNVRIFILFCIVVFCIIGCAVITA